MHVMVQEMSLHLKHANSPQVRRGFYDERRLDKGLTSTSGGAGVTRFDARRDATGRLYEYQCPSAALVKRGDGGLAGVRITAEEIRCMNEVLACFEGSHDFHNFTSDKCSDEGPTETVRFVTRFSCGQPRVNSHGVEYLALIVEGDSFMWVPLPRI